MSTDQSFGAAPYQKVWCLRDLSCSFRRLRWLCATWHRNIPILRETWIDAIRQFAMPAECAPCPLWRPSWLTDWWSRRQENGRDEMGHWRRPRWILLFTWKSHSSRISCIIEIFCIGSNSNIQLFKHFRCDFFGCGFWNFVWAAAVSKPKSWKVDCFWCWLQRVSLYRAVLDQNRFACEFWRYHHITEAAVPPIVIQYHTTSSFRSSPWVAVRVVLPQRHLRVAVARALELCVGQWSKNTGILSKIQCPMNASRDISHSECFLVSLFQSSSNGSGQKFSEVYKMGKEVSFKLYFQHNQLEAKRL